MELFFPMLLPFLPLLVLFLCWLGGYFDKVETTPGVVVKPYPGPPDPKPKPRAAYLSQPECSDVFAGERPTRSDKEWKDLKPFEFQDWVIKKMQAIPSSRKVGDMGLDGYIPKDSFREAAGIQVKKSQGIGRNVVDNFKSALERANYNKGYIVAISFSRGAFREAARLKNSISKTEIELVKVEDLISEKFTSKMTGEVATPASEVEPPCEKRGEVATPASEVEPPCEKCGKPMVWRKSKWGPFLGCSGYPQCKNIRTKKKYYV